MYQDKLPKTLTLPGGRKVRDYDHLTVEYLAEQKAAAEAAEKAAKKAEKAAAKKQAEDESVG